MMKGHRIRKVLAIAAAVIVVAVVGTEVVLRVVYGMCDALLYREDARYEYIAQPSQRHHRWGAKVMTNSFSQRSEEPDSGRTIVLGLGDSVLFGGTWMDHDSLATTIFSEATGVQMLNISAGSWGPDNCAAYLQAHGTFGAQAMILVCSSHDTFDTMTHQPVVDIYPNYPSRQYSCAIHEAWRRYLHPYINRRLRGIKHRVDPDEQVAGRARKTADEAVLIQPKTPTPNPGFAQLKHIADSLDIPLAIYLHAERGELAAGRYNRYGRMLIDHALGLGIPVMGGIESGEQPSMYHDGIHLNESGQRHLALCLERMYNDLTAR